jgi:hypothetical protein
MMNWAGFAFKCAQTDFKLGQDIMNIGANYSASKAKQAQLEMQAENFGKAADDFNKKVGRVQEQGRAAREQRMIQAGQDVGRINAGAAGSGIDVSSNTVRKTIQDTMVSAYNDAAVMAVNEAEAAHEMQNRELEQRVSKVWTEYNVGVEKVNRKMELIGGIMSAASNWMGGMADAGSSLMGG